jgi:hypothetical protein
MVSNTPLFRIMTKGNNPTPPTKASHLQGFFYFSVILGLIIQLQTGHLPQEKNINNSVLGKITKKIGNMLILKYKFPA